MPMLTRSPSQRPPRSAVTERFDVPVAGGELAVYRLPGAPDAPTVLAIHGITSSSHTWVAVSRALAGRRTLAAVDLRGRGRSNQLPEPFGLPAHVADMVAVLDALRLERALIVGHSLGAYIAAALAVEHPERVAGLILVDGALPIPGARDAPPGPFLETFLGAALSRLSLVFADRPAYRDWWSQHPAIRGADIDPDDLAAYADHDLIGPKGEMRSAVNPDSVAADGRDVLEASAADALAVPAVLLCAPLGLANEPNPMQPLPVVRRWADADPEHRRGLEVADTNHYSIVLGRRGAAAVAAEIVDQSET
jgi:pimeloyl-ACP methyl ester carboxylesterase